MPALVDLPDTGLYRAGRWADINRVPPPALPLPVAGAPLHDGPRWEDSYGRFATVKFSRDGEGAVGRTIAGYRRRVLPATNLSVIDAIKGFLIGPPDPDEPDIPVGEVPPDYFDDAHLLHIKAEPVQFFDLNDSATHRLIEEHARDALQQYGITAIDSEIIRCRDRRVTRTITRLLWEIGRRQRPSIAGLHYRKEHAEWDAYVVWTTRPAVERPDEEDPPILPGDFTATPIRPGDPDLCAAAARLTLKPPPGC